MVNYLLQSDSVGQPFGVGIDWLLAYEDILTQVYDIHEIPLPTGNHGSVIVIDQNSLSKADIISAIEYCSRSQLKCLLLVGQGGLEHVDYLHLVDDFCVCPVEHSELKARLSRLAGDNLQQEDRSIFKVNDLYIDLSKYDVYVGNRKVALTYKEFQLLVSLAKDAIQVGPTNREQTGLQGRIISDTLAGEIKDLDLLEKLNEARRASDLANLHPSFRAKASFLIDFREQKGGTIESIYQLKEIQGPIFVGEQPEAIIARQISRVASSADVKSNYQQNIKKQPGKKSAKIANEAKSIFVDQLYLDALNDE